MVISDNNDDSGLIDFRKNPPKSPAADSSSGPSTSSTSTEPSEAEGKLGEKLGEIDRASREAVTREEARQAGFGYVNLEGVAIDPEALRSIPESEAITLRAICFLLTPYQEVRLAVDRIASPEIDELASQLQKRYHAPVRRFLATRDSIDTALTRYAALPKLKSIERGVEVSPDELDRFRDINSFDQLKTSLRDVNVSERLGLIIAAAMQLNASDVHIEAESNSLVLRLRIDGVLHEVERFGKEVERPLFSRVKLVAGLKINVTDRPQDGHFIIRRPGGKVDVRVSAVPTNYGESLVMRILRSDIAQHNLEDLGLSDHTLQIVTREIRRPNGLLVVCGPTGSGKTTTLYAALSQINTPDNKVLTIEDPIEYELPGINQSQVNSDKGYTFAAGLRALVRQDPDIILVGEMRDEETVEISINAALTGHLVFSTMHTNDAAGSLPRFLAMAAKPYLLAPALNSVLAQRLVRRICEQCKTSATLTAEQEPRVRELINLLPEQLRQRLSGPEQFYTATGCEACNGLGYKGRIGIFEMFSTTPELKDMVLKGDISELSVKQQLKKQQMITMAQDGVLKALRGITSIEEVFRVVEER